jgi:hypothetical protein
MNRVLPLLTMATASCLYGTASGQESCRLIADDQARLACYDKANNAPAASTAVDTSTPSSSAKEVTSEKPAVLKHFVVRDQGTWNNVGSDPAVFSVSRNKGQDASLIKAAVIWTGNAFNDYGWQPFASAAINRNTLKSSATDVHSANIGITGSVFDFTRGFAIWSTFNGSAREDIKKDTASNVITFDNYVVIPFLVKPSLADSSSFSLFPRVGLQYEDQYRVAAGSQSGTYRGTFWGARGTFSPAHLEGRVQFQAVYQRYHDISVSSDHQQRNNGYTKLTIDYYLYDPSDETIWFKPAIGLVREVGSDPLTASLRNNLTSLAFKIKLN